MRLRLLILTTLFFSIATSTSWAAKPVEVRYGTWAKEGEAQYIGALKFKEVIEKESNGAFEVSVYPGDQLGTPREMLAQLALNTTQICASGDPGLPVVEIMALPYLMKSIKNYEEVMESEIGQEWNKALVEQRKVRLLGFVPRSPRQISANKVINTIEDLKDLETSGSRTGLLCRISRCTWSKTHTDVI